MCRCKASLLTLIHLCELDFNIHIGYTMKPRGLRDLDARENLYIHPCTKRKCVYGFQGDLNPVGPESFIVDRIKYLYYSQSNCFSP